MRKIFNNAVLFFRFKQDVRNELLDLKIIHPVNEDQFMILKKEAFLNFKPKQEIVMKKKNLLARLLGVFFIVGCASQPNWHQTHYQNSNKGAQCIQLCTTGQVVEAYKHGCNCNQQGQGVSRSTASSNGNTNVIYFGNQSQRDDRAVQDFSSIFQNIYEQERSNRMHSDKVRNGHYNGQD